MLDNSLLKQEKAQPNKKPSKTKSKAKQTKNIIEHTNHDHHQKKTTAMGLTVL